MPAALSLTSVHVVISLIALIIGLALITGFMRGVHRPGVAGLFLATTLATTATGYIFPNATITPAQVIGAMSLVALMVAVVALYAFGLGGVWRAAYVVAALLAFYLNAFVSVVQAFQKLPALQRLAPTQSELPFVLVQLLLLVAIAIIAWISVKRFRPAPPSV
jgi:hypothetical protein